MRYYQPYGAAANAPYVNGNPATGIAGSIPPAEQMEHPQRELADFITKSGLTPTELDLGQLAKGVQLGKVKYAAAAGTANAVTATLSPVPAAYQTGMTIRLKMSLANTGATTLNLNGIGAVAVVNADASALVGGEWGAATIVTFIYDGTNWQFIRSFNAAPNYAQKIPGFFYAFANPAPGFTNLGAGVWTKISVTSEQYDREGWYDAANSKVSADGPRFLLHLGRLLVRLKHDLADDRHSSVPERHGVLRYADWRRSWVAIQHEWQRLSRRAERRDSDEWHDRFS
jgi:hypothetical protein